MKDDPITRPRATRVQVKVDPLGDPGGYKTEIEMEINQDINQGSFNHWPLMIFSPGNQYEIKENEWSRDFPGPGKRTVTYNIDIEAFPNPNVVEINLDHLDSHGPYLVPQFSFQKTSN